MKLDNIFIGFTKDGKRHLLYKRYNDINGCSYSEYVDLDTKNIFTLSDIDINALVNIKKFDVELMSKKCSSIRKVKNVYKSDNQRMIDISRLVYANIYYSDFQNKNFVTIRKNALLMTYDNDFELLYKDLFKQDTISLSELDYDIEINSNVSFSYGNTYLRKKF